MIEPIHISYSSSSSDGGIAVSISQLLEAQQSSGLYSRWLNLDRFQPLFRDQSLKQYIQTLHPNIIHLHGLWRSHTRYSFSTDFPRIPYLISPHGMLDPWAMSYSPLKKWISMQLWESSLFSRASCIHALCEAEAVSIRNYVSDTPIAVVPNGITLPPPIPPELPPPLWHELIPPEEKVILFLGRYHHKKGLEPLLSAWQSISSEATNHGWWLCFIGYGDDGKLQSQLLNFPVPRCIAFGPAYNNQKASSFFNASAFVLPSFSEGLPMAALEAMSYGLPCLLSSACNLPDAFSSNAALCAEPDIASLTSAFSQLFHMDAAALSQMGSAGRNLVSESYDWHVIAKKFESIYSWILGDSAQPVFVS